MNPSPRYIKHGHAPASGTSPTYKTWYAMVQRCTNKKDTSYKYYGGRGIKVHSVWVKDFRVFLRDVGVRPKGKTLDRIDNEDDYVPRNVRWASYDEQKKNKRESVNLRRFRFRGKMRTVKEVSEITGVKIATINTRLRRGLSIIESVV